MTMRPLSDQRHFTLKEFCERIRSSERKGRRIIASGKIGVCRIGRSIRIPEAEIERFLNERFYTTNAKVQYCRQRPLSSGSVANIAGEVIERYRRSV